MRGQGFYVDVWYDTPGREAASWETRVTAPDAARAARAGVDRFVDTHLEGLNVTEIHIKQIGEVT